eukprot:472791-Pyramimonas_sp.AAC.1
MPRAKRRVGNTHRQQQGRKAKLEPTDWSTVDCSDLASRKVSCLWPAEGKYFEGTLAIPDPPSSPGNYRVRTSL